MDLDVHTLKKYKQKYSLVEEKSTMPRKIQSKEK